MVITVPSDMDYNREGLLRLPGLQGTSVTKGY
jgi:hypothetical protein